MTFQQIYQEVIDLRFNSGTTKLAEVKKWVNAAEVALWNGRDWGFKRVPAANITVAVSGLIGQATAPADFGKARRLWDPYGSPLKYLAPDAFDGEYRVGVPAPGLPAAYTVGYPASSSSRTVFIGPGAAGTYTLAYNRRYTKLNNGGSLVQGVMSVDTDTPFWDVEHHYVLVPLAIRIGEVLESDPTVPTLEGLLRNAGEGTLSMLAAMEAELLVNVSGEVEQWGG